MMNLDGSLERCEDCSHILGDDCGCSCCNGVQVAGLAGAVARVLEERVTYDAEFAKEVQRRLAALPARC